MLGRLKEHGWKIPLIAISSTSDITLAVHALKNGANTFLVKPVPPGILLESIHSCFEIDRQNHETQLQKQLFIDKLNRITEREKQVMFLTVDGYGSEEIAAALGISKRTAEKHKANMMHKLGIHKLSQLIRAAILYLDDMQNRY
jgi:FixJ family two-component response regulator